MQQAFPAAFMEKTLDPINHQAALIQQFRGTHGRPNRHFIQTLHRLYGAGFVRNNFRHIYTHVMPILIDRPAGQDSILAVTFPYLHGNLTVNQIDQLQQHRYGRSGCSRAMYSNLIRHVSGGLPPMLIYYHSVSSAPFTYVSTRYDSPHLYTDDDFRWIHDQVLQYDFDLCSADFWRNNVVPSRTVGPSL